MEPDIYALSKAGFSKERIEEITRCDDKEIQIRMLRKCRYQLWMKYMESSSPLTRLITSSAK